MNEPSLDRVIMGLMVADLNLEALASGWPDQYWNARKQLEKIFELLDGDGEMRENLQNTAQLASGLNDTAEEDLERLDKRMRIGYYMDAAASLVEAANKNLAFSVLAHGMQMASEQYLLLHNSQLLTRDDVDMDEAIYAVATYLACMAMTEMLAKIEDEESLLYAARGAAVVATHMDYFGEDAKGFLREIRTRYGVTEHGEI